MAAPAGGVGHDQLTGLFPADDVQWRGDLGVE